MTKFDIALDSASKKALALQVHDGIYAAIADGRLLPGARLPSWRVLATQLGVSRGTVQAAYERLADDMVVETAGSGGTRVASELDLLDRADLPVDDIPLPALFRSVSPCAKMFALGVPAADIFPTTTWSRMLAGAARRSATAPSRYPDPRGEFELRREISGYLAIARGLACAPSQIIITAGHGAALALVASVLRAHGETALIEDPSYPITKSALRRLAIKPAAITVDEEGFDIEKAVAIAPGAAFAVVTPGQQAPLGMAMSVGRRLALLDWAANQRRWVVEDDYLGELQLTGRAAPALAGMRRGGRVIHLGTFSKTMSPSLRIGFLVAPESLAAEFGQAAATLAPAPAPIIQSALSEFIVEGHYLRHLRRMKRLYSSRRALLCEHLNEACANKSTRLAAVGTSVMIRLPPDIDDRFVALRLHEQELGPSPLSEWYNDDDEVQRGLIFSATNYTSKWKSSCALISNALSPMREDQPLLQSAPAHRSRST